MDYGLRRIKRKETYEEWLINCTRDDKIVRTDVVVILFKKYTGLFRRRADA